MVRSPWSCEGTPLKPAPTVVCARTSLAVTTRPRSAMRKRYGLTPHRVGELDGSQHTSGAKASRSTHRHRRRSRGRARIDAGRRLRFSAGASRLGSGNAQRSGWRDGPRRFDGDARRRHAHGRSHRSATLTLLDVPLHVWRGAVLVRTRNAVQTGATKQRCSVF